MARGVKKSVEQHKFENTYRADRHAKKNVSPEDQEKLTFDPFMAGDTNLTEKQVFNTLAGYLYEMEMTQSVDRFMLQQWSTLYCAMRDVKQHMNKHGYDSKYGSKMAINIYQELAKDIRTLLAEYNLTPNTRYKFIAKPDKKKDNKDDTKEKLISTFMELGGQVNDDARTN